MVVRSQDIENTYPLNTTGDPIGTEIWYGLRNIDSECENGEENAESDQYEENANES